MLLCVVCGKTNSNFLQFEPINEPDKVMYMERFTDAQGGTTLRCSQGRVHQEYYKKP